MSERVTLLAGGDAVYLFDPDDERIAAHEAVLDVAYPADDVVRCTIATSRLDEVRRALQEQHGVEIHDYRRSASLDDEGVK